MAGFIYFISGGRGAYNTEMALAAGIGYAFAQRVRSVEVSAGPDGRAGLLAVDAEFAADDKYPLSYIAERQVWQKLPGVDIWVGAYRHALPGPEELLREEHLSGYPIRLADGQWWRVPLVKMPSDAADEDEWDEALPCDVALDENGRPVRGGVQTKYNTLETVAQRHVGVLLGENETLETVAEIEAAVIVLAANYRLRMAEVVLLGLLTYGGDEARGVLDWAVGVPKIWALKKNAVENTRPSNDGDEDDSADTDPA